MNSSQENDTRATPCEFSENLDLFRQISFFAGMPLQVHKVLAYLCTREQFDAGESIFNQGEDDGLAVYLIQGSVLLTHTREGRVIFSREQGPGHLLGGLSLLGSAPKLFSVEAATHSVCILLTRDKFSQLVQQFPEIVPKAIQDVIRTIIDWDRRLLSQLGSQPQAPDRKRVVGVSLI